MSIYIPNIEIPKEDRLTLQISADGAVYVVNKCNITAETYTTNVIPVPPHGRLGDLDRLEAEWKNFDHGVYYDKATFVWSIQHAPTIIPAEEGD